MEPNHLKLHVEILPFLNVALYLNDIPFVRYNHRQHSMFFDSSVTTTSVELDCYRAHGIMAVFSADFGNCEDWETRRELVR